MRHLGGLLVLASIYLVLNSASNFENGAVAPQPREARLVNGAKMNASKEARMAQEQAYGGDEQGCNDQDDKEKERAAQLVARAPGVSVPDAKTLLSAVAIVNRGKSAAINVEVTSIRMAGGTLITSLPASLGTIATDGSAFLDANFSGGSFRPGGEILHWGRAEKRLPLSV